MPTGPATHTAPRARRSAHHPAALLSLLATLALRLLAGLPGTADAEVRSERPCATAKVRDPACPAQRFTLQVTLDVDEPAGEGRSLALARGARLTPGSAHAFCRSADRQPHGAAGCPPERPPRRA